MAVDLDAYIVRLDMQRRALAGLMGMLSEEQARWKPGPDNWSALEVINHLADEEREDFRTRVRLTLFHPGSPWPPIDPKGWVRERSYNSRDLNESMGRFLSERDKSLAWLRTVQRDADWCAAYQLPSGPRRAGDLLAAWAAHDLLHLRQLVELHYAYLGQVAAPFELAYAGEW